FYATTSTTVGYGDLSPQTTMGRLFAAFLLLPGGVVFIAAILGKLSTYFIGIWRKKMQGKGDYSDLENHIVVFGWHQRHTKRMIDLIYGDSKREDRKVLLCTTEDMDNPFPELVLFVRGQSLTEFSLIQRTGALKAARIIVYRSSDDQTLATCLTLAALKTKAHMVAWFENDEMSALLKSHCPDIECHSNISMELLVRSAQDPGSSRIQQQLLSTLVGPTQYSVRVPEDFSGITFGRVLEYFKLNHEAIALGVADSATGDDLKLNPASSEIIRPTQVVYYMAAERIHGEIEWSKL
ncbi:MAG: potassium channel family protein, partial [Endozoicomonas sp.]